MTTHAWRRGRRPVFQQKRIDLMLGLDIATVVARGVVSAVVLVSGDSDLIPAVGLAQEAGVLVRLVHGSKDRRSQAKYHQELWDMVDERVELDASTVSHLAGIGPTVAGNQG